MFTGIVDAFKEGGWGMYPILIICLITFYLIFDRVTYLAKSKVNIEQLMAMIKSQLVAGNIRGAISTCDAQPVGTTKIIAAGLRKAEQGGAEHEIQQSMDEEALRELPKIEKRTGYLAMLGNLATLCGLLGTITGLIKAFASVAGVDPSMKATMLSKGISEAMNCTAFGLGTGILGLAAFAWLNGKTQHILDGVNQSTVETLNLVVTGRESARR
jgi:biopolymer transport protein ExbB